MSLPDALKPIIKSSPNNGEGDVETERERESPNRGYGWGIVPSRASTSFSGALGPHTVVEPFMCIQNTYEDRTRSAGTFDGLGWEKKDAYRT